MAAITGCTTKQAIPNGNMKEIVVITPATADSADTLDVSSEAATGGDVLSAINHIVAYDNTTGDLVPATYSGTTITLDAAGGTTNHTYTLRILGTG